MISTYPERIICLTEETTETLYLLGEERRIVGISGFTVRPPRARREKPKVSAFISAKIDEILDLKPDLVLGFSDLQADIAQKLIRHGVEVHVFNHRSVVEILRMIGVLGGMIGCEHKAQQLVQSLSDRLATIQHQALALPKKPRVYFEEWDEPIITAIAWVAELIELAGGEYCFPEFAKQSLGKDRIVADPTEVIRRAPDIMIGSWCGKKFRPEKVAARPGWKEIPAVRDAQLFEIKSPLILQPGPAALTDGLDALATIIQNWAQKKLAC